MTTFEHYIVQVEHLEERRAALEKEIHALAETEAYSAPVARLSCLRGISTLGALVLLTELFDLKRFDSPRQLMAFVGLVPSEYSSGRTRSQGGNHQDRQRSRTTDPRRSLLELPPSARSWPPRAAHLDGSARGGCSSGEEGAAATPSALPPTRWPRKEVAGGGHRGGSGTLWIHLGNGKPSSRIVRAP